MAFAGDLTLVEVRDSWLKADGTPERGTISFTPSVKFRSLSTGQQIAPTKKSVSLDADGNISVQLPAVDDTDYDPVDFTYRVDVQLDDWRESYDIAVPSSAAGAGLDLGLMARTSESGAVYRPFPSTSDLIAMGEDAWLLLA